MIELGFNPDSIYVIFNSLSYEQHKILRKIYQELTKSEAFSYFHSVEAINFIINDVSFIK